MVSCDRMDVLTIGFAFSATTVLDLEAREVRIGLDFLDERHLGRPVSPE